MDFKVPMLLLSRKQRTTEHVSVATDSGSSGNQAGIAQVETELAPSKEDNHNDPQNGSTPVTSSSDQEEAIPHGSALSSNEDSRTDSSIKDNESDEQSSKCAVKPSKPSVASQVALQYTEPRWSGPPTKLFSLLVIKNGVIVDEVNLNDKPYHTFGRLPLCDVALDHPSLSRYHAVVQYRPPAGDEDATEHHTLFSTNPKEEGFYVYDLGSTHGTFVNKFKIQPRCYYRLRVGQNVRFGGSSRMFVLQSSASQEEVEAEAEAEIKTILHHKERLETQQAEAKAREELLAREREEMGATWGMAIDDVAPPSSMEDGQDIDIDPDKEAYYIDDPKKALRKFFDREGLELEYETEEEGQPRGRVYTVRVRLPIDTVSGEGVYAEASVKGKKKEAVVQCALNACRMLDVNDMLQGNTQSHKRKTKNWEDDDYYDSDDDTFLDRTGTVERKRKHRMQKAGVLGDTALTYQSLQTDLDKTQKDILTLENKLAKSKQAESSELSGDSLDAYMRTLGGRLDKTKKSELKHQLLELKKEEEHLKKLMNMAKPTELPALASPSETDSPMEISTHPSQTTVQTSKSYFAQLKAKYDKTSEPTLDTVQEADTDKQTAMISPDGKAPSVTSRQRKPSDTPGDNEAEATGGRTLSSSSEPGQDDNVSPNKSEHGHSRKRRRKSRTIGPTLPPQLTPEEKTLEAQSDPDYSDWLPPDHQTGDGRTHLNEKFGY